MALNDENPIAFIKNQLEGYIKEPETRNRMLDDISKSYGWDKNFTEELLKMGLKSKYRNY